jgi:hypothetical protein
MKTILAVTVVAAGLGAAVCGPKAVSANAKRKCEKVVLTDTVWVSADTSKHKLTMSTSKDTVPKPYMTCVTLYASAKDTVTKP